MKKTNLIVTLSGILCAMALTGCNANVTFSEPESGEPASINIEVTASETVSNVVQETEVDTEDLEKEAFAIDFNYQVDEASGSEYAIVTGTGDQGSSWVYETVKCEIGQACRMEHISSPAGMLCINEGGTIVALDYYTGNVLWQNSDYNGGGTVSTVDVNNNLYVAGNGDNALVIMDDKGNTLLKVEQFADYFWPTEMYIIDDILTIVYDSQDNAMVEMNINDYSYTIQ